LAVEYDGGNHRYRLVDDNRRQNGLVGAGFRLLRFTAADVYGTPDAVLMQVRQALPVRTSAIRAQMVASRAMNAANWVYMVVAIAME
jgi:very-short-patch-repair endonuclease